MKWLAGAHCDLDAALGFVETRFRDYCGRHQCRASDIADRPILTFPDTLGALQPAALTVEPLAAPGAWAFTNGSYFGHTRIR